MLYCRLSGKQESLSLPKYNLNIYMRSTVAAAAVQRKVQGVVSREVISPEINISTLYSRFNKVQNSELGPDLNQTRKMVENWYSSPIYQQCY